MRYIELLKGGGAEKDRCIPYCLAFYDRDNTFLVRNILTAGDPSPKIVGIPLVLPINIFFVLYRYLLI